MRIVCVAVLVAAASAWAQCASDAECPSGGSCSSGACVTLSPPPAPGPEERRDVSVAAAAEKPHRHWAGGAASLGFTATGPVVASGILSMFFLLYGPNSSNVASAVGFTLLTMALVGGLGPLVEVGAASARFEPTNEGSPGARVLGWVFYGLSLGAGVASLATYFANDGGIAFLTALGMLLTGGVALICFGVDAVVSGAHANAVNRRRTGTASVRLMPGVALAPGPRGDLTPVVGLTGLF